MAIPSSTEFRTALIWARRAGGEEYRHLLRSGIFRFEEIGETPSEEPTEAEYLESRETLLAIRVAQIKHAATFMAMPAVQWICSQLGFKSANAKLTRKGGTRTETLSPADWVDMQMAESKGAQLWIMLEEEVRRTLVNEWLESLVRALYAYYYSDRASDVVRASKQLPALLDDLERRAMAVRQHAHVLPRSAAGFWLQVDLDRQIQNLREAVDRLPISRDGPRKRELLFVHQMWRVHQQLFRAAKAEVITDLMTMEGFRYQFDIRTVERLSSKWKGLLLPRPAGS